MLRRSNYTCVALPPRLHESLPSDHVESTRANKCKPVPQAKTILDYEDHARASGVGDNGVFYSCCGTRRSTLPPTRAQVSAARSRSRAAPPAEVTLDLVWAEDCLSDLRSSAAVFMTVARCFSKVERPRILVKRSAGLSSVGTRLTLTMDAPRSSRILKSLRSTWRECCADVNRWHRS